MIDQPASCGKEAAISIQQHQLKDGEVGRREHGLVSKSREAVALTPGATVDMNRLATSAIPLMG